MKKILPDLEQAIGGDWSRLPLVDMVSWTERGKTPRRITGEKKRRKRKKPQEQKRRHKQKKPQARERRHRPEEASASRRGRASGSRLLKQKRTIQTPRSDAAWKISFRDLKKMQEEDEPVEEGTNAEGASNRNKKKL